MDERERYDQGMKVRREVAGDAHVDRAEANRTPFNDAFQDFITRYAWGEVWARPGLDRHTRSMITLAMLIALNREAELRMHLIAAANNGVSRDEIKELLLHAGLYCGLPAANSAYQLAAELFAEQDVAAEK
jgi:4-carboxymuconolactone decarboxylase